MSLLLLFPASGAAPTTGTATWTQAAASWEATLSERIATSATFAQSASWDATASEELTATASLSQSGSWSASSVEVFTASGSFYQEHGLQGQILLIIIGYASPAPPEEFLLVTGQLPLEEQ